MGILKQLKNIDSPLEVCRFLTLASADAGIGRPQFRLKIALTDLDEGAKIEEDYPLRNDDTESGRAQQIESRHKFGDLMVRGWEGLTPANLAFVSRRFMQMGGEDQLGDAKEIPYDDDNRNVFMEWIDKDTVGAIIGGALNTVAFAEERARAKKK